MISDLLKKVFGSRNDRLLKQYRATVNKINALEPEYQKLDDEQLRGKTAEFKTRVENGETLDSLLPEAFAAVREAAVRVHGMRHYDVQLIGGMALHQGKIAEMRTGEGKTLMSTLPAYLNALTAKGVHIVTVNDYLAGRDAETLRPLFDFLGLTVGVIRHGVERPEREAAYRCEVTYCTNKELVFDYLRDRVAARGRASVAQLRARRLFGDASAQPLLRGLHYAIVDEADSVLIDEARTPLILAEAAGEVEHAGAFEQALALARGMTVGAHFELDAPHRALWLSDDGRRHLLDASAELGAPWAAAHAREHLAVQALRALHLFHRDQHYLVDADDKVQIIDESTGRVLPGRTWEQGLHQMVETKEGVPLSEHTRTLARITYQRFFPRYLRLAGMTGTASEVAAELAAVYRLDTVVVPPNRPCRRVRLRDRLCADQAAKWRAVADFVAERHGEGQPVLVGTRSLDASEALSRALDIAGLPHAVLNARQDANEAAIVAKAGEPGAITVATNMAGRGTDIRLGDGVATRGGLCVVLTEFHESVRIDRQLFGRSARQGDPGSCVVIVALDDDLFVRHGGAERRLVAAAMSAGAAAPLLPRLRAAAQSRAEAIHARTRRDTMKLDRDIDRMMSVSGEPV